MSTDANKNDDVIFEQILKRSATDAEFRARLISDPASAIEETIGVPLSTLPRPINVKFIEKEAGVDAVLVLPDFVEEGSLSDAELEAVAGGMSTELVAEDGCNVTCICTSCCVTEL
jgi:hypothetical protein